MENLVKKRGTFKSRITTSSKYLSEQKDRYNTVDEATKMAIVLEMQSRLEKLQINWEQYEEIQGQIEEKTDKYDEQLEERTNIEASYFKLESLMKQFIREKSKAEVIVQSMENAGNSHNENGNIQTKTNMLISNIKLPQIDLPSFAGTYDTWLGFRDTYQSLIHNNNRIGDIDKFHYLRASLRDGAAQVVNAMEFSEANYQLAWELLCERYDNKSLLVHTHVKALFNLPTIAKESSKDIRVLIDELSRNLRSLEILELPTHTWDTLVIYLVVSKLDSTTSREWEEAKNKPVPSLEDLKEFLKHKADLLETIELSSKEANRSKEGKQQHQKTKAYTVTPSSECPVCKANHAIYNCNTFLGYPISRKIEQIKKLHFCLNCLKANHFQRDCRSGGCRKCGAKHNTLLHQEKAEETEASAQVICKTSTCRASQVLLATARVQVVDSNGYSHTCRALLDCGAQSNFITSKMCGKLKLERTGVNIEVSGITQSTSFVTSRVQLKIQSIHTSFEEKITCLVMNKLSDDLPSYEVNYKALSIPPYLRLADPSFHTPSDIDLIIGTELFWKILCVGRHELGPNAPIMQKPRLGWIIAGRAHANTTEGKVYCKLAKDKDLQAQLEKFWTVEEPPKQKFISQEEKMCEDIFKETTTRTLEGRFVVTMPLKESAATLGESKQTALRRFQSLERKFQRNSNFKERYVDFMTEYLQLGHMSKIVEDNSKDISYYFPHHGVINESSLTTKLRVVFDGSAATTTGYSLNDIQMVGPLLQNELLSILLRFRQHTYVICGDIKKMYRQILINTSQQPLQRVLWREDSTQEVETYELQTVTYGTTSAPYLAIKCLTTLAEECAQTHPNASTVITSDFYVDDLITGGEVEEDVLKTVHEVVEVLKSGCFDLHKWTSNEPRILQRLHSDRKPACINLGESETTKTLGVYWECQEDSLKFKIQLESKYNVVTKRSVLAQVAQIFDPFGLLCPIIVNAKIILKALWRLKLTWDESLPLELHNKWSNFRQQLHLLNSLKVPRHVICNNPVSVELHGFADASEEAYGGCIYLRSQNTQGEVQVHLLTAKSRVAPMNKLTIPRLELCAAVVLTQLLDKVTSSMTLQFDHIYLWSDSTVALHWIHTQPSNLQTFVANRVAQIQKTTQTADWHHVASEDNPADLVSRGVTANCLISNEIWWHGPRWLLNEKETWPKVSVEFTDHLPELKKTVKIFKATEKDSKFPISKHSSLLRLKRIMAYCRRALTKGAERQKGDLTAEELEKALMTLVKVDSQQEFRQERIDLERENQVSVSSSLSKLNPFVEQGQLRVGGRIQLSDNNFDKKHPIVLGKTYLTKLILRHEHERLGHAGPQLTLASIREKFWPISGRSQVRKVTRSCITCFKANPREKTPIMGILPEVRVTAAYPFQHSGVDYAGPIMLKDKAGRGCKLIKGYICIFICMSTKAIHLELVTDLTMETFIGALRRFTARRGKPTCLYSDNATNFVAAQRELEQLATFLQNTSTKVASTLANDGIQWKFIPARAPHFGGLWEAGVRSVKYHLKRMVGDIKLNFEHFYTVITQVEAILNSRPLTPISSDPNDFEALTPAHFLIGRRATSVPDPDLTHLATNRLSQFQQLQHIQQHFWARWRQEYLGELQTRVKWTKNNYSIKPNTLVIIKDDLVPTCRWKLGRIIEVLQGPDGVARVALIRTADGNIKRAFSKICPLPTNDCESATVQV